MSSTKQFFFHLVLLSFILLPCLGLIQCEYGNYTRAIGVPRAANGLYEKKECTSCFAFECDIFDLDVNSTTVNTTVRLFGAGCDEDLEYWCDDLWKENEAKIKKNEAFNYSGKNGSVIACLTDDCARKDFESTFDPNNSNIAIINFCLILFIYILFV